MKMHRPIAAPIEAAAEAGLREGGRGIMADAKGRAPVDDKDLRNSARLRPDGNEVMVVFTAPHAWLQHERLDYAHPNGGEAKYLEHAAIEYDLAAPIAEHIAGVLGG